MSIQYYQMVNISSSFIIRCCLTSHQFSNITTVRTSWHLHTHVESVRCNGQSCLVTGHGVVRPCHPVMTYRYRDVLCEPSSENCQLVSCSLRILGLSPYRQVSIIQFILGHLADMCQCHARDFRVGIFAIILKTGYFCNYFAKTGHFCVFTPIFLFRNR